MKKIKNILILTIFVCILFVPQVFAGGCVLGPKVTKDLIGALNIIRIVAPLLIIGFTILDTIKALTQGDASGQLKVVFNRLKKRFLYLVLLIFVPTLVKITLNIMGLTSDCDLQGNPDDTSAISEPSSTPVTIKTSCESFSGTDVNARDMCIKNGCKWDSHSYTCSTK